MARGMAARTIVGTVKIVIDKNLRTAFTLIIFSPSFYEW